MSYPGLTLQLKELEEKGLKRTRHVVQSAHATHVTADGREFVAFCSNDYLGLAAHPDLVARAREGAERFGVGAGASHLLLGHSTAHHALEQALARFVGLPRALLFSTGYMANIGAVTALVGRDDAVFADRLNHASLNDAVVLSRAGFRRYPHLNLGVLEKLLAASQARRKLVVTDAVFSMDGDLAPVRQLVALCERRDAMLLLDDAHGFGVLGRDGRGVLSQFDIASSRVIYMATLGKAAGVFGAFVAGGQDVVETMLQRARSYVYTTATPPLLSHVLIESLRMIECGQDRRDHLWRLIRQLKEGLRGIRWRLLPSDTAIQPLVIGPNDEAVGLSGQLACRGLLVPPIRPPTVPSGTARLRISLSAAHSENDVGRLIAALRDLQ